MAEQEGAKQEGNEQQGQQFIIQKIYCKDISFETPNSPVIFTKEGQPELKVDLNTSVNNLAEGLFEVVLQVTATTEVEGQTAFLAEVHQAGIFNINGFEGQQLDGMLGSYCPSILFPYARETVSDLVTKGGFPQLVLQPVNFDAIYAQHLQERQKEAEAGQQPAADSEDQAVH